MDHAGHGSASRGKGGGPNGAVSSWLVRILIAAVLGVGASYIIVEHRAHFSSIWLLLLLLACPLLHVLHGGHGGHAGHGGSDSADDRGGRNA